MSTRLASCTLFLCGDVMTGRGIDQVLPHPGEPALYEPYVRSAIEYVRLAEEESGPIPKPVGFDYVWGDALAELARRRPDARIVNLETAVTTSGEPWPGKGVHYRMHPANVPCLAAAALDCCVLANNHVLDWGYAGLAQTLDTLHGAGLRVAGAGRDAAEAATPATIDLPAGGRVLVFAYGMPSSGVPSEWAAAQNRPGINFVDESSLAIAERVAAGVRARRRAGDIIVASIHWGENWSYAIAASEREFAHRLIDGGVDTVHGHSSHHVKGIEVYRDRPILYGCGDLITDYEGIHGHEAFRGDLALMYFPTFDTASGKLSRLELTPLRVRRLRLAHASEADAGWLIGVLNREGGALGTGVAKLPDGTLAVEW
ncbi:MAG TPA: CapA family protein [Casimicrobiaceae bacterium]|nr:CapA family protein [Casimicrobiaceae bacterium]